MGSVCPGLKFTHGVWSVPSGLSGMGILTRETKYLFGTALQVV